MSHLRSEAEFLLYQDVDGRTRVEVSFDGETAWDKSVISRHVKNVFDEGELQSRLPRLRSDLLREAGLRDAGTLAETIRAVRAFVEPR